MVEKDRVYSCIQKYHLQERPCDNDINKTYLHLIYKKWDSMIINIKIVINRKNNSMSSSFYAVDYCVRYLS